MLFRVEQDSLGEVKVPNEKYYGAQTVRSIENFQIDVGPKSQMPIEIIHAYAYIKKAASMVNCELELISKDKKELISQVCDEILEGLLDDHFPLLIWQTGSGTQTNMNVNEVVSNRAIELVDGKLGSKDPIHPNDDVNKSQSSNDTFPTAMHIAAYLEIHDKLIPALENFEKELLKKAKEFEKIVKTGRTHLMDAAPLTLGQEFSAYATQIKNGLAALKNTLSHLSQLSIGGTAVGTGLNSHPEYANKMALTLAKLTHLPLESAENKFESSSSHDAIVEVSGALKRLACSYMKIANDIRLLGSGPRCGFGELNLPTNEPGSSIMPGKVNPTQCEALTMLSTQVMGNDTTITIAGSQGAFELNVYKPVMIANLLQSIKLLADGANNFVKKCLSGLEPNTDNIEKHLNHSLMLATALNTHIGYDKASQIVKKAFGDNITLKEAALELKLLSAEEFDKYVDPKEMIHP